MSTKLIFASLAMTIALILYTLGVFGEKKTRTIQQKHLLFFLGGLIFDSTGISLMSNIAKDHGGSQLGMHQITGALALGLMTIHFIWALWVYYKGSEQAKQQFNKFSLGVWTLWLISFILGILLGMGMI